MTPLRPAMACLLALRAQDATAQSSPKAGLLEQEAWAALSGPFGKLLSGADAQVGYATSAVAARRLLDEAGGVAIANLLRDLGAGVDFETAFLHRIQHWLPDCQASLTQ